MALTSELIKCAVDEVERIISLEGEVDLKCELTDSIKGIEDKKLRKEFYRYMNMLFLNILLNRLDEVGQDKEERAINARKDIVDLIKTI
ncbi:MAG: hypothetical protein LBP64_04450 [Tannerella sp.]|jgi:hypothetical protein|nr:hypothetical protein [Tannerella sp.]